MYRGSILWGHKLGMYKGRDTTIGTRCTHVCAQNQFMKTSCMHIHVQRANPMGTRCISKNQSYGDGMYIHKDQSYGN